MSTDTYTQITFNDHFAAQLLYELTDEDQADEGAAARLAEHLGYGTLLEPAASAHVVEVFDRTDCTYVFADLDDARAFEATINGDRSYRPPRPPLGSACDRTEEAVCDRTDALKLIAAECEASEEAIAASLESGVAGCHARLAHGRGCALPRQAGGGGVHSLFARQR